MNYKFEQKWDENTGIGWWDSSRKELNKIIEAYNNWQIYEDNRTEPKTNELLALIEYGKQTIGAKDGGSGYYDKLEEMKNFIENSSFLSQN